MIGRVSERAEIERLLTEARSGRSGALVLCGEPGVGKSAPALWILRARS